MNQPFTGSHCCHGRCPVVTISIRCGFVVIYKNPNSNSKTNRNGDVRTLKITRCGGSAIPAPSTYLLTYVSAASGVFEWSNRAGGSELCQRTAVETSLSDAVSTHVRDERASRIADHVRLSILRRRRPRDVQRQKNRRRQLVTPHGSASCLRKSRLSVHRLAAQWRRLSDLHFSTGFSIRFVPWRPHILPAANVAWECSQSHLSVSVCVRL